MSEPIRILCYGDSNTWGYVPNSDHHRFSNDERYTGILSKTLGKKYEVISEGLNGRTLVSDDPRPGKEGRNGSTYLKPCLDSHDPINIVILMIGTNELKPEFNKSVEEIEIILEKQYVKTIITKPSLFTKKCPKLIIVCPPVVNENTVYSKEKFAGAHKKSIAIRKIYSDIAKRNHCYFVETNDLKVGADGVHLTKESHDVLAKKLLGEIKKIKF